MDSPHRPERSRYRTPPLPHAVSPREPLLTQSLRPNSPVVDNTLPLAPRTSPLQALTSDRSPRDTYSPRQSRQESPRLVQPQLGSSRLSYTTAAPTRPPTTTTGFDGLGIQLETVDVGDSFTSGSFALAPHYFSSSSFSSAPPPRRSSVAHAPTAGLGIRGLPPPQTLRRESEPMTLANRTPHASVSSVRSTATVTPRQWHEDQNNVGIAPDAAPSKRISGRSTREGYMNQFIALGPEGAAALSHPTSTLDSTSPTLSPSSGSSPKSTSSSSAAKSLNRKKKLRLPALHRTTPHSSIPHVPGNMDRDEGDNYYAPVASPLLASFRASDIAESRDEDEKHDESNIPFGWDRREQGEDEKYPQDATLTLDEFSRSDIGLEGYEYESSTHPYTAKSLQSLPASFLESDEEEAEDAEIFYPAASFSTTPIFDTLLLGAAPPPLVTALEDSPTIPAYLVAPELEPEPEDMGATSFLEEVMERAAEDLLRATLAPKGFQIIDYTGRSLAPLGATEMKGVTHLLIAATTTPDLINDRLLIYSSSILRQSLQSGSLVVLNLSNCHLLHLPPALSNLISLAELDLSDNPLDVSSISAIGQLRALRVLIADRTGLTSLPCEWASLVALHTLSVRSNRLLALDSWLWKLSPKLRGAKLEVLLVEDNPFRAPWIALVTALVVPAPVPVAKDRNKAQLRIVTSGISAGDRSAEQQSLRSVSASSFNSSLHSSTRSSTPTLGDKEKKSKWSTIFKSSSSRSASASSTPSASSSATRLNISSPRPRAIDRAHSLPLVPAAPSSAGSVIPVSAPAPVHSNSLSNLSHTSLTSDAHSLSGTTSPLPRDEVSESEYFNHSSRSSSQRNSYASPDLQYGSSSPTFSSTSGLGLINEASAPPPATPAKEISQKEHARALDQLFLHLRDIDDLSHGVSRSPVPRSPAPAEVSVPITPVARTGSTNAVKAQNVLLELVATEESYLKGLEEVVEIYMVPLELVGTPGAGDATGREILGAAERKAVFGNIKSIRDFHAQVFLPELSAALKVRPLSGFKSARYSTSPDQALDPGQRKSKAATEEEIVLARAEAVARVFIRYSAALKIYSAYVINFDNAILRIKNWADPTSLQITTGYTSPATPSASSNPFSFNALATPRPGNGKGGAPGRSDWSLAGSRIALPVLSLGQKKRIAAYLKRCKSSPQHSQISLDAYLLLPVQRIPRYRMLLESLGSSLPLATKTRDAHLLVAGVATYMNEKKREAEGNAQLLYWQDRIGNTFRSPLVQPHRTLIREGVFILMRVVKRLSSTVELPLRDDEATDDLSRGVAEVHELEVEEHHQSLIALLCSDIIVFLKTPAPSSAPGSALPESVELFTVLRLSQTSDGRSTPASVGADHLLRIACDARAILYVECYSREDADLWASAINSQSLLST